MNSAQYHLNFFYCTISVCASLLPDYDAHNQFLKKQHLYFWSIIQLAHQTVLPNRCNQVVRIFPIFSFLKMYFCSKRCSFFFRKLQKSYVCECQSKSYKWSVIISACLTLPALEALIALIDSRLLSNSNSFDAVDLMSVTLHACPLESLGTAKNFSLTGRWASAGSPLLGGFPRSQGISLLLASGSKIEKEISWKQTFHRVLIETKWLSV